MATLTISPKYQVVIPRGIRRVLGLKPGQKLQAFVFGTRIELVPVRPLKELRGFLKGPNDFQREKQDRL